MAWGTRGRIVEPFIGRGGGGAAEGGREECSVAGEGGELSFRLANLETSKPGGEMCLWADGVMTLAFKRGLKEDS